MLRIHFLQQGFSLCDPGAEDALYESVALRRFTGVDLGRAAAPDKTTILRFRRSPETLQDGTRFRALTMLDVYTRESVAIEVGQRLKGDDVVRGNTPYGSKTWN